MSKSPEPFYFYNSKIKYLRITTKTQYRQNLKTSLVEVINTTAFQIDYKIIQLSKTDG
jgi:hypothetical protein